MVGSRTTEVTRRGGVRGGGSVWTRGERSVSVRGEARSGRGRRGATAAVGLLAGVLLAGCQSNPEPPPVDAAEFSASPSPTASPTPEPPQLPAKAEKKTRAGAKAFVRHWIEALNYAGHAGNPELVATLSNSDCRACTAIVDFISEVDASGGYIKGRGWTVKNIAVISGSPKDTVVIDVLVRVHPQKVKPARNRPPETFDGGRRLKTFWVASNGEGWVVTRLDQPS